MIVEKPDILKQWMADVLEHMSDAQPAKLARYVLALVRKAGSATQLRDTVLEQLAVFLHEGTALFADRLLAALASGSYTARPGEGRVVTLPAAPPARRHVQLPPEDPHRSSPSDAVVAQILGFDHGSGSGFGSGSPVQPCSEDVATSSPCRSPVQWAKSNGRPAPSVADPGPVSDLRQRLGAGPGRRRCPDFDGCGICLRGDDCPLEHGPERVVLPGGPDPPAPVPAPLSQPVSPSPAAVAESCRPDAPGLTAPVWRSSLPADAARQLTTTPPTRTVSIQQDSTDPLDTCSLLIREIPPDLNQIMPLNDHLSQFGRIVNIQVSFGDDPSAAVVTFACPEEAEAALSSPEPVLGCSEITLKPHSERPAINGRQMALSGLKRTVTNPDATLRIGEQDPTASESQTNGDTVAAAATNGDPPDSLPQQEEGPSDQQGAASGQESEPESARPPSEETEAARRQSAEARRQNLLEIRRSQDLLAANVALEAVRKEKQQAARRLAADLQRREADLLERQLEQQRSLLQRLDSPGLRPAERQTLLAALRALQAASLSTRAGLAAGLERREGRRGALRRAHPAEGRDGTREEQPAAKLPARLPEQTEREVLDLELALYQRQLAGAETEELQRRLSRLRQAAVSSRGRGRGTRARGRGRGRGSLGPGPPSSIDRRPSTLIVSDFDAVGREETVKHLTRFGAVTDCRPAGAPGALAVTFGTRRQAEAALAGGATVGPHRLTLGWPAAVSVAAKMAGNGVQNLQTEVGINQTPAEATEEPQASLSDFEDEEGEDADDEDERSWRP